MDNKARVQSVKFLLNTHNLVFSTYKASDFTADDMVVFLSKVAVAEQYTGIEAEELTKPGQLKSLLLKSTKA
jgi:hypothetical protein